MKNKFVLTVLACCIALINYACKDNPVNEDGGPALPDTTTHNIVWETDTLGTKFSNANAVWGTSEKNVYLAGYFLIQEDPTIESRIKVLFHWDGSKWEEMDYLESEVDGIDGISENKYSYVGQSALVAVDEVGAHVTDIYKGGFAMSPEDVWYSDNDKIFAVGGQYDIGVEMLPLSYIYENGVWTEKYVPGNLGLKAVWGVNDTCVYAVGWDLSKGLIVKYNGNEWEKIYEGDVSEERFSGLITAVWGFEPDSFYFSGVFGIALGTYENHKFIEEIEETYISDIYGSAKNNVFICGGAAILYHYNGSTWHRYDELLDYSNQLIFNSVWTDGNVVFVVGTHGQGFNSKVVVYRGTFIK